MTIRALARFLLLLSISATSLVAASAMTSDVGQWRTSVASGPRANVVKATSDWLNDRLTRYGRISRVEDGREIVERTQLLRLEPDRLVLRTSASVAGTVSMADVHLPLAHIDASAVCVVPDLIVARNSAIWVTAEREEMSFLFRWHILFNEKLDEPSEMMSSGARIFCSDPDVAQEIAAVVADLAAGGH